MPSTTTTTVTIGTILDLIGPTTSSAMANDDQTGFDSLLQAPQAASSTPSTDDSRRLQSSESRRADHSQEPANNDSAANNQGGNSSQDHTTTQSAGESTSTRAESRADKSPPDREQPSHDNDRSDDQLATEQIIAQSLAGLPTARESLPAPTKAVNESVANDSDSVRNTKPKNRAANSTTPTKVVDAQSVVAAADSEAEPNGETDNRTENSAANPLKASTKDTEAAAHQAVAKPQAGDTGEDLKRDDTDQAAAESQLSGEIKTTSEDQSKAEQTRDKSSTAADTAQLAPDTSALAPQPQADIASPGANVTPIVAPTTNILPTSDQPGSTPANNSNNTAAIGGASPRGRLPAQALAPAANTTARHASVDLDAARLIGRVVRAFSAAQERDGEVRLRLSPPELGSLQLDVRVENGALTAHLQTETDAARVAIVDNLPLLRERLAEQGVRIERFDVDLMQRQPGGMPDQSSGRQPNTPEAPARLTPPSPASRAATSSQTNITSAAVNSGSGGLNVIV